MGLGIQYEIRNSTNREITPKWLNLLSIPAGGSVRLDEDPREGLTDDEAKALKADLNFKRVVIEEVSSKVSDHFFVEGTIKDLSPKAQAFQEDCMSPSRRETVDLDALTFG